VTALLLLLIAPVALAKKPPVSPPLDHATRWVRASDEYLHLVDAVYHDALDETLSMAAALPPGTEWTIVADVDETLLDNSGYAVQVGPGGYAPETWKVWVEAAAAPAIPGAVAFVDAIRAAGGHVALITNREDAPSTQKNLEAVGLFRDGDRLCGKTDTSDKEPRRRSVREGTAVCGWEGHPMVVLAWLGDQMGDFPKPGEDIADPLNLDPWGRRYFVIPNPIYGAWESRDSRPVAEPQGN
jgi:5'-nucleotidase (lipoprotein e(P4) family)